MSGRGKAEKLKATPAPWYITGEGDRRYIREEASDACIALMLDGGHVDPRCAMPEHEIAANAHLMAASRNLYDAMDPAYLREAAQLLKQAGHGLHAGMLSMMADTQERALARARGESAGA